MMSRTISRDQRSPPPRARRRCCRPGCRSRCEAPPQLSRDGLHHATPRGRVRFIMQRRWQVSLVVVVGVFMASLDLFIVNIAFPAISQHFGNASLGSLSWVLSGYAIVFAALLVPA